MCDVIKLIMINNILVLILCVVSILLVIRLGWFFVAYAVTGFLTGVIIRLLLYSEVF